jgi:hypothetical protein
LSPLLFVTVADPLAARTASLVTGFFSAELAEVDDEDEDGLDDDEPAAALAFSRSLSLSACSLAFCLASSEVLAEDDELELEGAVELDDALTAGASVSGCLLSS